MSLKASIAVTRFGLGAQRGEIKLASESPENWLLEQLDTKNVQSVAWSNLIHSSQALSIAFQYRRNRNKMMSAQENKRSKSFNRFVRDNLESEVKARAIYAAQTKAPFHERLTRFWANHFSVSARNRQTNLLAGAYEREAIRPNILGNFTDLAIEAIFHPAMLTFLDNVSSVGPNSRAGQRRNKGLNENLAREVLELHTITPAAGYDQKDVTEFAKALTGWTIGQNKKDLRGTGRTTFNDTLHEPGMRKVLGRKYSNKGNRQAISILKTICAHPDTAKNIAQKLARHFVSDIPPPSLVKRLEDNFIKTNGDLKSLYETLVSSPEAWVHTAQKVKSPEELLTSTARAIGIEKVFSIHIRDSYDSLAQRPFSAPTPEGWPDTAESWLGPDAIMKRIEWANEFASTIPNLDAVKFLYLALGPRLSDKTRANIMRAESQQQALVLALMSPDYQRR